jgi:DNA (cytosine-5)-methyltransferase 1
MSLEKAFTALSLYTGAGGLDLGFEAARFDTRAAVEIDRDCVATLRANRPWPVIDRSIHDVTSAELLRISRLEPGEADVLIGGPPCQPFSKAGYWASGDARRLDDPRADTVAAFLRVLRDTQPRAFLIENVAALAFKGKDEGLRLIQSTWSRLIAASGPTTGPRRWS